MANVTPPSFYTQSALTSRRGKLAAMAPDDPARAELEEWIARYEVQLQDELRTERLLRGRRCCH